MAAIVRRELMALIVRWTIAVLIMVVAAGCATLNEPERESLESGAPQANDQDVTRERPSVNVDAVVRELQHQALEQQAQGQYSDAAGLLERALRIDGHNGSLYQQIAEVRLSQGRFVEAEQIALRGLSLAEDSPERMGNLWRVIAQARSGQGDTAGARQARAKQCDLRGC